MEHWQVAAVSATINYQHPESEKKLEKENDNREERTIASGSWMMLCRSTNWHKFEDQSEKERGKHVWHAQ